MLHSREIAVDVQDVHVYTVLFAQVDHVFHYAMPLMHTKVVVHVANSLVFSRLSDRADLPDVFHRHEALVDAGPANALDQLHLFILLPLSLPRCLLEPGEPPRTESEALTTLRVEGRTA